MRKAASVLQRVAMAHAVSRRLLAYAELQRSIRREAAAVKLQSQWRCHSHLQRFHKVRMATLVIQRMATAHAARCRQIAQAELEQSIAQKDPETFEENESSPSMDERSASSKSTTYAQEQKAKLDAEVAE